MTNPNFGIALGPNAFDRSFGFGVQLGRQAKEAQRQNALSAFAQDPNNPDSFNALAKHAPRIAIRERELQAERANARTVGDALTGNANAREQIAYFDPDLYLKLQGDERNQAKEGLKTIAQILESAQSEQEYEQIVSTLGRDNPEFLKYRGRFAEKPAILAQAGELINALERAQPSIGFIPDDATGFAKNPAGERVLRALNEQQGPTGGPPPEQPSTGATVLTSEQIGAIRSSLGEEGTQAYLARNNIVEAKQMDGQTYYRINGQWFDELPGGQSPATGNFP